MAWVLIGCGAFSVLGALMDWDWFMNNHKARFFVALMGRQGARGFYMLIGLGLIIGGTAGVLHLVNFTNR